jgi:hypothetical protein
VREKVGLVVERGEDLIIPGRYVISYDDNDGCSAGHTCTETCISESPALETSEGECQHSDGIYAYMLDSFIPI